MSKADTRIVPAPPIVWAPHPGREDLEQAVHFTVGYIDPTNGPRSIGRHGMNLRFLLKGPKGVTQFLVYTNWMPDPDHILPESLGKRGYFDLMAPMGADVGYHAYAPQWEGQEGSGTRFSECDVLGVQCFYDGSGLRATELLRKFVVDGTPAVWSELESYYDSLVDSPELRQVREGPLELTEGTVAQTVQFCEECDGGSFIGDDGGSHSYKCSHVVDGGVD